MSEGRSAIGRGRILSLVHGEVTCHSAEMCFTYTQPQTEDLW